MAVYETNFAVSSSDGSEEIEIRNPNLSLKSIRILRVGVVSEASFSVFRFTRYTAIASHESSPVAAQQSVYEFDAAGASPAGQVWMGEAGSITWNGSADYVHDEQLDPSDAGDDAEWVPSKYHDQDNQIVIAQNRSMRIQLPEGQNDYTIKILWEEVLL